MHSVGPLLERKSFLRLITNKGPPVLHGFSSSLGFTMRKDSNQDQAACGGDVRARRWHWQMKTKTPLPSQQHSMSGCSWVTQVCPACTWLLTVTPKDLSVRLIHEDALAGSQENRVNSGLFPCTTLSHLHGATGCQTGPDSTADPGCPRSLLLKESKGRNRTSLERSRGTLAQGLKTLCFPCRRAHGSGSGPGHLSAG